MALLLRQLFSKMQTSFPQTLKYCTAIENEVVRKEITPVISKKEYPYKGPPLTKPRELWLENLDTIQENKLGLVTLHSDIFGAQPRIDLIFLNIRWQRNYRRVNFANDKTRAEMRGGGRKPWPQKGTGRARHGSIRSPLWSKGGTCFGRRNPTTWFYMLPFYTRVYGLITTLSVKLAQDDLHIINDLEIPTDDQSYIEQLIQERNWGPSVLFIDVDDYMPRNITVATNDLGHVNLMPVYGLNVYSMLKHNTLVLTKKAAREIEDKLLFQLHRTDSCKLMAKFRVNQQ
ncbi:large ribosomal subunit protein uL4m [Prorops nasuta]|uniref:large ribosomal subunit protein uL4m n=1 Tax=Prorops nasuta TaxID=863751 RepID=UPI0034D01297